MTSVISLTGIVLKNCVFDVGVVEPTRISLLKSKLTLPFFASTKKPWQDAIYPSGTEFTDESELPVVEIVLAAIVETVAVPPVKLYIA